MNNLFDGSLRECNSFGKSDVSHSIVSGEI